MHLFASFAPSVRLTSRRADIAILAPGARSDHGARPSELR
eukprot:CAMPEP_0170206620 /NCGR_PEP_ID=MMETSP0116_2-20130129/2875_1 /TAXON_ID=400756 /ORGANISM="Durinskia baltica, Strain CSIRO CS-38" /LENGTH=39 /DNA_ID= /DNA_START= /DNA_END= /DNA_ORIENTATION=